jgi:hypothetical protein
MMNTSPSYNASLMSKAGILFGIGTMLLGACLSAFLGFGSAIIGLIIGGSLIAYGLCVGGEEATNEYFFTDLRQVRNVLASPRNSKTLQTERELVSVGKHLVIRFNLTSPYCSDVFGMKTYRIGVFSGVHAENVRVVVENIEPLPNDEYFRTRALVPYRLYLENQSESCSINPGDEEYFLIAKSWIAGGDQKLRIGVLGQSEPDEHPLWCFRMSPEERWKLTVKASSANAGTATLGLLFRYQKEDLCVELLSEQGESFVGAAATIGAKEWLDLGSKFKELAVGSAGLRADWTSHINPKGVTILDDWRIAGGTTRQDCEALCKLAGAMLMRSPCVAAKLSDTVRKQTDNV